MNKRNYQKELDQILAREQEQNRIPRLLLHSCCAPCSSYVLEYLSRYFQITVYYYNPNIDPPVEYIKRVKEQEDLIKTMKFQNPVDFISGVYEPKEFYQITKGYEKEPEGKERCFQCYELRIEEAAKVAKAGKYDYFTTTLSISPLKNAEKLNEIGEKMSKKYEIPYLLSDFKKKEGYQRSIELSKQYGLYRQNYCGCIYSRNQQDSGV